MRWLSVFTCNPSSRYFAFIASAEVDDLDCACAPVASNTQPTKSPKNIFISAPCVCVDHGSAKINLGVNCRMVTYPAFCCQRLRCCLRPTIQNGRRPDLWLQTLRCCQDSQRLFNLWSWTRPNVLITHRTTTRTDLAEHSTAFQSVQ